MLNANTEIGQKANAGGQITFDNTDGISIDGNAGGVTLNGSSLGVQINGQSGGVEVNGDGGDITLTSSGGEISVSNNVNISAESEGGINLFGGNNGTIITGNGLTINSGLFQAGTSIMSVIKGSDSLNSTYVQLNSNGESIYMSSNDDITLIAQGKISLSSSEDLDFNVNVNFASTAHFSNTPETNIGAPTLDTHLTNKKYVDDNFPRILHNDCTDSSAVTGTTTNTIISSYLIPANTLSTGRLSFDINFKKTGGNGSTTVTAYIRTSNTLSGDSGRVGTWTTISDGRQFIEFGRKLTIKPDGNVYSFPDSISNQYGESDSSSTSSGITIDTAIDNYIIFAIQNNSAADSVVQKTMEAVFKKATN